MSPQKGGGALTEWPLLVANSNTQSGGGWPACTGVDHGWWKPLSGRRGLCTPPWADPSKNIASIIPLSSPLQFPSIKNAKTAKTATETANPQTARDQANPLYPWKPLTLSPFSRVSLISPPHPQVVQAPLHHRPYSHCHLYRQALGRVGNVKKQLHLKSNPRFVNCSLDGWISLLEICGALWDKEMAFPTLTTQAPPWSPPPPSQDPQQAPPCWKPSPPFTHLIHSCQAQHQCHPASVAKSICGCWIILCLLELFWAPFKQNYSTSF